MNLIKLNCNSCNAQLELDLDNMQAYCPYCGNKLMFDVDQIGLMYAEREKTKRAEIKESETTKRKQMDYEYNSKAKKFEWKKSVIGAVFTLLLVVGFFAFCYYGIKYIDDYDKKAHDEIIADLQQTEEEIKTAISNEDYDSASLLVNKLRSDDLSKEESKVWEETRKTYSELIEKKRKEQEINDPNNIFMPSSSKDFKGLDYEDVMRQLRALGFTNVSSQPATEPAGLFKKKNTVEHILVGDVTKFSEKDYFLKDTKIIVYYYVKK